MLLKLVCPLLGPCVVDEAGNPAPPGKIILHGHRSGLKLIISPGWCGIGDHDVVIIGGGVAGYVAAIKAGQAGLKVRSR